MVELRTTAAAWDSAARSSGPVGSLRLDLRRDTAAPATARAAVESWYPELAGGRARLDTVLLLVSELVTNAVMHSRAPIEAPVLLTAEVVDGSVRVAVTDAGDGFTPASYEAFRPPQRMTVGGYGLYVVDQAATRWGVDGAGGVRVWFEL